MRNGYNVFWTEHALYELDETFNYLQENFTEKELKKLALKIEETIQLITLNPFLFQKSNQLNIYKVPILKYNTLYYRIKNDTIEILSFFSNRKNPKNRKI